MHSPSLRKPARSAARKTKAQQSIELTVLFDGWYRARTEPARQITGWTPEEKLREDFERYLNACGETADVSEAAFRDLMNGQRGARMRKLLVQKMASVHETLEDCWDRSLLRPIKVAA